MTLNLLILVLVFTTSSFSSIQNWTWKRYAFGSPSLSIELPTPSEKTNLKLSEDMSAKVKTIETYQVSSSGLFVMMSFLEYKEGVVTDAKKAAQGAMANVRAQAGLTDFTVEYKELSISGKRAVQVKARYRKGTTPMGFSGVYIVEGQKLWQVNLGYATSDLKAQEASERILRSIRFIPSKS
ncbi:MAG TPA: hypothetical protein VNK96_09865 [Fimbriimonadales bacterium]|nr:hypothetical protein [Fimbriimonadales bacterium]